MTRATAKQPAAGVTPLAEALRAGDRRALARAITLVESTKEDHRPEAGALLEAGVAPGQLVAIERNASFCKLLRERFHCWRCCSSFCRLRLAKST